MTANLNIRTTLTLDSIKKQFGPPCAIDYRAHPGATDDEDPVTIFIGMKEKEVPPLSDISVLKGSIYSFKNRRIITRWLRDVCSAFDLKSSTLCLSIQLSDAYLINNLQNLKVDRCQLAAITSLWIAAKFEEMDGDLPQLRKIVDVCDHAYTAAEVLGMEESILSFFKWRLPHTTVLNHLYLQIHMLSTEKLVQHLPVAESTRNGNHQSVALLIVGEDNRQSWSELVLDVTSTLKDSLPCLCQAARMPHTSSMDVFQLYGKSVVLARRKSLDSIVGELAGDADGQIRLYLASTAIRVSSIFVERGSYTLLRSINSSFLSLCDILLQEVVTHVEFLRLPSHVTAFGILGLALCLHAPNSLDESNSAVKHIYDTLMISATQAMAAADLLNTKYAEAIAALPASPTLPPPSASIRENLARCFDRPLQQ